MRHKPEILKSRIQPLSWITLHGAKIALVAKEMLTKLEAEVKRLGTPRLLSLDPGSEVEDIHEIALLLPD